MGYGLEAPASVVVELRVQERRVFRLSRDLGPEGLRLVQPAPFEIGRPVALRLTLPDTTEPWHLNARIEADDDASESERACGGCGLRFLNPPEAAQIAITRYVCDRLGIAPLL